MSRKITNPKVGEKVVRGPNWDWGNQDEGSVYGVITEYATYDEWLTVNWVNAHGKCLGTYGYPWKSEDVMYYEEPKTDTSQKLYKLSITLLRDAYDASVERGCEWHNKISNIIAGTPPAIILDGKAFVEEKHIKEFFEDSSICNSWKSRIKTELPEYAEILLHTKYLKFESITGLSIQQGVFIAQGMAKDKDDVNRVILVDSTYEVEIIDRYNDTDRTGIKFKTI